MSIFSVLRRAYEIALFLLLVFCLPAAATSPETIIVDGAIKAPTEEAVRLDGAWRFAPGMMLEDQKISARQLFNQTNQQTLTVPGNWNAIQGKFGKGTYQVELWNLKVGQLYALRLSGIATKGQVWLDEDSLGSWGATGVQLSPMTYYFKARNQQALLSISVENHQFNFGGIWCPVVFGPVHAVDKDVQSSRFIEEMLIGGVLIIAIYHMGLFWFRRNDMAPLYFSVFCFLSVFKASLSGEQLLYLLTPSLDQGVGLRVAFLLVIAMPIAFMAYIEALFPAKRYPILFKSLVCAAVPTTFLTIFANLDVLQSWFWLYQLAIIGVLLHVSVTLVQAMRNGIPGTKIMLTGFILLFIVVINDILHDNKIIVTFYALNIGVFFFLVMQSLLMSSAFARAFRHVEEVNDLLEQKVAERTRELEQLSHHDHLTSLMNRRWFLDNLHKEWDRWERYGHDFCVAMIDLDHFKQINDTRGHAFGDAVLKSAANVLKALVRKTDMVARYGGDEFCILFPTTNLKESKATMEKVKAQYVAKLGMTFSYGVALASQYRSPDQLIDGADQLMYDTKQSDRSSSNLTL